MQMVMMVFRTTLEDQVLPWLEHEQQAYTRLDSVGGKGASGAVPGSVTWGGSNTVILTAVPDERFNTFRDRVFQFHSQIQAKTRSGSVPFHTFVLPCVQWM
jgi:hypothetical protein